MHSFSFILSVGAFVCLGLPKAQAVVVVPQNDQQVIEVLPNPKGSITEQRKLLQKLAQNPKDAQVAVEVARQYLSIARKQGDPRFAGRALAVLQPWPDPAKTPDEVLLMLATLQQYLHEFDHSVKNLELIVTRNPRHAQAWLTLATVKRVQGRYTDSDLACQGVATAGESWYARACTAENNSLRGNFNLARQTYSELLAKPNVAPETRAWLLTTAAEGEARAGNFAKAEQFYIEALALTGDAYTALSYSDFLLERQRPVDALTQLRKQTRTDAVLLRLAIAGVAAKTAQASSDVRLVREQMASVQLRPEARTSHARELAMFALWVDQNPKNALISARENIRHQREPLDILILAQAAKAANEAAGLEEVRALIKDMGLRDQRLQALLS